MERGAPVGLWLVSASQVAYVLGSFSEPGGPALGTVLSVASAACAAVSASALSRSDRTTFAWGIVVFAIVQLFDYLTSLSGANPFLIGFTLIVIGLAAAAASAQRWRRESADAQRPQGTRFGAGLASLGAFSYLAAGFLAGANLSIFTTGALAAGVGWALVALT